MSETVMQNVAALPQQRDHVIAVSGWMGAVLRRKAEIGPALVTVQVIPGAVVVTAATMSSAVC